MHAVADAHDTAEKTPENGVGWTDQSAPRAGPTVTSSMPAASVVPIAITLRPIRMSRDELRFIVAIPIVIGVPLLVYGASIQPRGLFMRDSLADFGATIADIFSVERPEIGRRSSVFAS